MIFGKFVPQVRFISYMQFAHAPSTFMRVTIN